MLRVLLILVVMALPAAARHHTVSHKTHEKPYFIETGRASFYGEKHDGQRTANGETFDRSAFTAAHPSLPFGTILRVTNLRNHRMVKVRITDRGPHVRSRVIDVSSVAAREIGMQRRGVARVRVLAYRSDQASQ